MDLYVANLGRSSSVGERTKLFQNGCDLGNNWLIVKLEGTLSNRDGIGARIVVEVAGRRQIREVGAGTSFLSHSDLRVHFGLGSAERVDRLVVRWPSGVVQEFTDVQADQWLVVSEEAGISPR